MAAKGCKCADGSYRTACCRRTKRSKNGRRTTSSNKMRSPTLSGPMSPTEYAMRRKQQAFVHVLMTPQGRRAMAYGGMQVEKAYTKVLGKKAAGKVSLGIFAAGRVGSKFIPIVGQIALVYDTYRLGKWMHGKLMS